MGLLDKLKKGIETTIKSTTKPVQAPTPAAKHGRYGRLVAWIKTRYGNRFRDGFTNVEVESQLENIFKELETQGTFKKHPKIANGFRAYINERKYGDLVRVSE